MSSDPSPVKSSSKKLGTSSYDRSKFCSYFEYFVSAHSGSSSMSIKSSKSSSITPSSTGGFFSSSLRRSGQLARSALLRNSSRYNRLQSSKLVESTSGIS